MPKSRVEFWQNKFEANRRRDLVGRNDLHERGIKDIVIWECSVKKMQKDEEFQTRLLKNVVDFLTAEDSFMEL